MGGYSVECDCGKWFVNYTGYKDHCKSTGHKFYPDRVGRNPVKIDDIICPHCKCDDKRYFEIQQNKKEIFCSNCSKVFTVDK